MGKQKRTLIYIHGMNNFAAAYARKRAYFFKALREEGTKVVLAQAPLRERSFGGDDQVRSSWFLYTAGPPHVSHEVDPASMVAAREAVEELIAAEKGAQPNQATRPADASVAPATNAKEPA